MSLLIAAFLFSHEVGYREIGFAEALPRDGFQVFTHEDQPGIAEDAVGLRFTGPITDLLATQLSQVLLSDVEKYNHVVLELDSEGGDLESVKKAADVLETVSQTKEFTTRVMGGATCASGCIALFMQGQKRKASGASVWVFHGACRANTNVPSVAATQKFLDLLIASGVNERFTCLLVQQGYVTLPGTYVISGFELFHHTNSNIITELLPAWHPEKPYGEWIIVPR